MYGFTKERHKSAPTGQADPLARLLMFKSTDGDGSWTTRVINEGAQDITNPAAAVDPETGNLYVVYNSRGELFEEGEAQNPSEVYFLTSSDAGATWSQPASITDDDPAAGANQYFLGSTLPLTVASTLPGTTSATIPSSSPAWPGTWAPVPPSGTGTST